MKTVQLKKPLRSVLVLIFSSVIIIGIAGCSSDDDKATKTKELKPADQVESERNEEKNKSNDQAEFGEKIDLGSGLSITVSDPKIGGDDGGPWIDVQVRAENTGKSDDSNPGLSLVCGGSTEEFNWQADSTYPLSDSLPAGSFNEGRLHLLAPEDGRYGEPVPDCTTPAFIRVEKASIIVNDESKAVDIPLSDDLVQQLNAKLIK